MTERICQICPKTFEARNNRKTCSPTCALELKRSRDKSASRTYHRKNPGLPAIEARIIREKRAALGFVQRTYWVHLDDADELKQFAKNLLLNRRNKS